MTLRTGMADILRASSLIDFAAALGIIPDPWQAEILDWRGSNRRLMMNCSRQSGKSTIASVIALHRALFRTKSLSLLLSPSLRQSGELFRKVLDALKILEPTMKLPEENRLSLKLPNGSRIVSLPGTEGTVRGFSGASLIILDESSRVPDELYYAIRPMLAISHGDLMLLSTPFGKRGHFHAEWTGNDSWERYMVTADQCPRISPEFLLAERASIGDMWFRQEYGCQFLETIDQVFSYDHVMAAITSGVEPLFAPPTGGALSAFSYQPSATATSTSPAGPRSELRALPLPTADR